MIHRISLYTLTLIICFVSAHLAATQLTLSDYLSFTLENNADAASADLDVESAKWDKYRAFTSFLPTSKFSLGFTHNSLIADNESAMKQAGFTAGASATRDPSWSRTISVSLPVFIGGSRLFSTRIASMGHRMQNAVREFTRQNILAQATAAFFDAYMTQQQLKAAEHAVKLARGNLERARILTESGRTTDLDLLNFRTAMQRSKQAYTAREMELREKFAMLERTAGRRIEADTVTTVGSVERLTAPFRDVPIDEAVAEKTDTVLNTSPVIRQLKIAIDMARETEKMAWTSFFPTVMFTYSHDFGYAENHPFKSGYGDPSDTVMLSMDLNIFNGFNDYIDVKTAGIEKTAALIALDDIQDEQRYTVRKILTSLYSLMRQRETARATLDLSRQTLDRTREQYDVGVAAYLDVLSAQDNFIAAEQQLIIIKASIRNTVRQLEFLSGKGE